MYRTTYFVLIFIALFTGCNSSNRESRNESISKIINELVKENNIPGLNLSIIYNDGKQEDYSSGYADVENKQKLTPEHVMFSGSIGKTYAVAVIMQLVEEGKLDLSKKIIHYFPETDWLIRLPNIQYITIEMLLQHTTGLPRYEDKQGVWDTLQSNPDKIWTYKDRLSLIFGDKSVHEAGKGWDYSDTNYILLGMLIEKVTGSYYYDEVKKRGLIPANLMKTYPATTREIDNLSTGYSKLDDFYRMPEKVVVDSKYCFNPQLEWTGGSFASTTSDLAKWAKIYYENKLFSKKSAQTIVTPNANGLNIKEGLSYGMGSFIYKTKAGTAYGHTGFMPGFVSIFAYYPKQEIAISIQINCDYAKKRISLVEYLDRVLMIESAPKSRFCRFSAFLYP